MENNSFVDIGRKIYDVIIPILENLSSVFNFLFLDIDGISESIRSWIGTLDQNILTSFLNLFSTAFFSLFSAVFGDETPFVVAILGGGFVGYLAVTLIAWLIDLIR